MNIYLIRHGESTSDVENKYGGAYDDHLTEKGRTGAVLLAERLQGKGIEAIYCSPLLRAKEAADTVNEILNLPLAVVEELRERDYGILNGMDKDEARATYPEIVEKHKDVHTTDLQGESYEDFKRRVLATFQAVTNGNQYNSIAIFTHGGPIKLLYRELLSMGELEGIGDYGILTLTENGGFKFAGLNT
ncbi:MAG: histidine phosphatase family protein [Candidatus Uhrbacteria bacterium]|nr:histidine phosphatase family protein [Candidatus Uhrbacteria bacterium]